MNKKLLTSMMLLGLSFGSAELLCPAKRPAKKHKHGSGTAKPSDGEAILSYTARHRELRGAFQQLAEAHKDEVMAEKMFDMTLETYGKALPPMGICANPKIFADQSECANIYHEKMMARKGAEARYSNLRRRLGIVDLSYMDLLT